ncbi:hypothetical protein [Bradyrhizobium sp. HKCCYLS3013]|uniref:hypothetical protein n=1 Tax=Bradyrhizobium sp. HKCCYLS3013 TaxID=3420735 RepID=UPI003EBF06C7
MTTIDSISELAHWLRRTGHRTENVPCTIAPSVISALDRIATLFSQCSRGDQRLMSASLFISTLREHAGTPDRLSEFMAWLATAAPQRAARVADLLSAVESYRGDQIELAAALDSFADHIGTPELARDFINLTLAHAERTCARYSDPRYPAAVSSLDDFQALPTLRRRELEMDLPSICADGEPIDFYTATSATTTGRSLLVPHCRAEHAALSDWGLMGETAPAPSGMTLRLMPAGRLIGAPLGASDTVLATYETNALHENVWDLWDYIAGQVFAEFPSPKGTRQIETIHATPSFGLILLTKYMLQRGLSPRQSAVRTLLVTGSWIGPVTRRWLEDSWGAQLHTVYSCSELVGGAVECPAQPGRYHFAPNLYPEVLDAQGRQVAEGAQGGIHLTALYPFQRSAAFLRYEVGDWGRWGGRGPCPCGLHGPAIELLGRTTDVLTVTSADGTRWPIPPVPIRNALDRFDCVPKIPRPQYRLRIEPGNRIELRVDVECYALAGADWQYRTRNAIAAAILDEDRSIGGLASAGELNLDVNLFSRSKLTNISSVI